MNEIFFLTRNGSVLKSVTYQPIYITVLKPVFPYIELDFGMLLGTSVSDLSSVQIC